MHIIHHFQDLDEAIHVQLESQGGVGDAAAIVVIKCPRCSTPIRRSNRYIKLLNERAMQIDKVKKKLLGDKSKEQLLADWDHLKTDLMERGKDIQLPKDLEFSEIQVGKTDFPPRFSESLKILMTAIHPFVQTRSHFDIFHII
jgi:uncharacterized C2H2 Zn-finger protein